MPKAAAELEGAIQKSLVECKVFRGYLDCVGHLETITFRKVIMIVSHLKDRVVFYHYVVHSV